MSLNWPNVSMWVLDTFVNAQRRMSPQEMSPWEQAYTLIYTWQKMWKMAILEPPAFLQLHAIYFKLIILLWQSKWQRTILLLVPWFALAILNVSINLWLWHQSMDVPHIPWWIHCKFVEEWFQLELQSKWWVDLLAMMTMMITLTHHGPQVWRCRVQYYSTVASCWCSTRNDVRSEKWLAAIINISMVVQIESVTVQ